ncbi:hypothetical protein OIU76_007222 [Salix suchowensis]|nr:hypothetical protein OIU76_007222 [Salix suchowensis]
MGSQPVETFSVEEQRRKLDMEDATGQLERAQWVLNSPDPPGLLQELGSSVREIIFSHGNKHASSAAGQKQQSRAMKFLQGLFPILRWGRDYKVSEFKNDLMAGLTLASLSIPQSIGYANLAKLDPQFIGRKNKKLFWFPAIAPLVSVILSTLIVYLTKADKHGVNIVRHIKGGLNRSSIHDLQLSGPQVGQAAKIGLISAIVALTVPAVTISFARILLMNAIRPGIETLGRLPRADVYCDMDQYPMAIKTPGILAVRVNSALLCFANANFIRERILRWVAEELDESKESTEGRIQAVILDMSNVMNIDTAGILALEELHKELLLHGTQLAIANPKWQVIHKLRLAEFIDMIGREWVFLTVSEAVDACVSSKLTALANC